MKSVEEGESLAKPSSRPPKITLVVPCYNEEACLANTASRLVQILEELCHSKEIDRGSSICMVDDGSTDGTWHIIKALSQSEAMCSGIRLSRNFGHQNALLAGLMSVPGDAVISMDADLQDDPVVIGEMLKAYRDGADIVFGVRAERSVDSFWKRAPAKLYYRLMQTFGIDLVYNHADYRLMSRRVIEGLREYREVNLFLRGLVTHLGYRQATVKYSRQARTAGETKYTLGKMLALAVDGITSFSAAPLRFIALLGLVVFVGSIVVSCWALWTRLFTDNAIPGWASSVLPIYLMGGIQLLSLAIVGEYVSKIFLETKARPRFLIQETSGIANVGQNRQQREELQRQN